MAERADAAANAADHPPAAQAERERPASLAALYRALWQHAAGARHLILLAFVLLLASQLFKLGVPWLAGNAIDAIQSGGVDALPGASRWLALVFAAIVASWLLHGPGRILERNVALKVRERLSALLVGRLVGAPLAWHESHHSGETTHRVQQSTRALYDFAQSQFIYLQNTVRLVGPIIALWLISPLVGAVAMLGYGLIGLLITRFDRVMMRIALDENRAERAYSATLVDVLGNVFSVLALRRGEGVAHLIATRLAAVFGPLRRGIVLNELKWCSVDLLANALWCVLVGIYAAEAAGVISPGGGVALLAGAAGGIALGKVFMVYEYAQQAGGVITAIAAHFQSLARQRADYATAQPVLDAGRALPPAPLADAESAGWQALELSDVRFAHAAARGGAAFHVERLGLARGRRYALVGPSGGGKSTLLRLLAGLDEAQGGSLGVDGRAVPAVADTLRHMATLIPQQAEMFDGTLAENLLLGGEAPAARIAAALHASCADTVVEGLPQGLNSRVSEGGANWSGGQRQRLALARGVLAAEGSSLVLLDEPTSSLDPETEGRVYSRLFEHFADAAVVSSVHRLHLLNRFDGVILMRAGRIEAMGTAWELAQHSALFRDLLSAQGAEASVRTR
ncbi:ATP-binding cassette domain-containing protein [Thauera linaloolentis]|uniref:ABC transporter n=1 Tax=Thauera linaloolentis (strain DSM 12138 / JCM 21573 / CCUG 41526 / CIP 105981 / IAM 15112 / NBRC 102519 / 47Lol) TaxID=1123367 RepID=N6ZCD1_THAL4|nr:ABC transporter ATP-binding protein [Thauera linaloolentis]ENO89824.1 ABC transporter [Thauera linaloolentis 47Lol = DSM 12138]MCM8566987.1 ABC transporter ATP-binding protein/permease [Thauera linaloolentis]